MDEDRELKIAISRELMIIKYLKNAGKPECMALLELPEELRSEKWRSL